MNIGLDAKRAYHNHTGLGHYSRTLINLLIDYYPEHHYYLFNPRRSLQYNFHRKNLHEILPSGFAGRLFPSAWRSSWVKKDLKRYDTDIYHGLSHEVPIGIRKTGIKSVVTIHDLIPERFPEQYNAVDVKIYRKKFRYACEQADKIIAISSQTKQDIIEFYEIPEEKIEICYQSCSPIFSIKASEQHKKQIARKYELPPEFFLSVGSIIERKNLLNVCKALFLLRNDVKVPLVVIGDGGRYKQQVKDFILQHDLENKVIFLSERKEAKTDEGFLSTADLAVIYQMSVAMVYPSFFEGFGIPVLEALCCHVPVITSNVSSLTEVGGPGALCVNPYSAEELARAMKKVYTDKTFVASMIKKNIQHAKKFTAEKCAASVMSVYKELME